MTPMLSLSPVQNEKQLLGPDGKPINDDNGFLLPHYRTFAAIFNALSRVYRFTWDEAIKHSQQNSLAMRRDTFIMALLQERMLCTAQRAWTVEPEDDADPQKQEIATQLTRIIKRTRRFASMRWNLLQALWYGRYASQIVLESKLIDGQQRFCVARHAPVNGDKIQYRFGGTPCVMIMASERDRYPAEDVLYGERSPMLKLENPKYRERFVIHQHECDDADYFEGEMGGSVQGIGIRSRIYWTWWLRDEMLSWAISYMEKVGTLGILLFYYPEGDAAAKLEAENAARNSSERSSFAVPIPAGADKKSAGVELLPASMAGVQALQNIISDYFEKHIERYIVGQSLSANAGSTGLGSKVAELHADTKYNLLKYDAENLDETITCDLIKVIQKYNNLDPDSIYYFRSVVPAPDAEEKLNAAKAVQEMGFPVDPEEVYDFAGLKQPEPGEESQGLMRPDIAQQVAAEHEQNKPENGLMRPEIAKAMNGESGIESFNNDEFGKTQIGF